MKLCTEPWTSVTIDINGDIKPCICADWNTVGAIGNLLTDELADIFNSDKLQSFKSRIQAEDYSMCTEVCPYKDHITDKDISVLDDHRYPTKILLSIDMNCNLACESCRPQNIFSTKENANARIMLDKIYDFYQDKKVELQLDGAGDLFASRAYQTFLKRKFNNNFKFHVITNGNLLKKQRAIIENIQDNIISIDVSLDAATAETYKKTRGGVFELVKEGIRMCVGKGIKVNLSFVVQQKNYLELKKCWELGVELGCHSIMYHKVRRWWHISDQWWQSNAIENLNQEQKIELYEQLFFLKNTKKIVTSHNIPVYMTGDLYNFKP